jgi:glycosyltransferase involved in cell wall biosynthesis
MSRRLNTWIVMPAFNEEAVVGKTVETTIVYFPNIVVVDDCSSDRTGDLAHEAGAHVCRHSINLGQGAALQTGIDYALKQGADYIVTFDADGQHRPIDAVAMVDLLVQHNLDVVLASRFLGGTIGLGKRKRLLLKLATLYTRLTTGLAITDTHNGLRVFSRAAAKQMRIRQNRMAHASEILELIGKMKLRYTEAPCTIIYTDYSKAKGQRMTGAIDILSDLLVRRMYK